jgi:hypothetical protein
MYKRIMFTFLAIMSFGSTAYADTDHPISDPATGMIVATRMNPQPPAPVWPTGLYDKPYAPFGLSDCEEMRFYANQFGLPARFDSIGWRESNCRNEDGVRTSCCHGYWQLHQMHFRPGNIMDRNCNADSFEDVNSDNPLDKQRQACAAKQLYDQVGLSPWSATR